MSVTAAAGFVAAGVHCGIKESGRPDLVAGRDRRRPTRWPPPARSRRTSRPRARCACRETHLRPPVASRGRHAQQRQRQPATGDRRRRAPRDVRAHRRGARLRADDVLVCSTGLIGIPLAARRRAARASPASPRPTVGAEAAAPARGPGDHDHRHRAEGGRRRGRGLTVGGMAKGAAMLAPNMATMLAVLTTDAAVEPGRLHAALARRGRATRSTASSSTAARRPTTP